MKFDVRAEAYNPPKPRELHHPGLYARAAEFGVISGARPARTVTSERV